MLTSKISKIGTMKPNTALLFKKIDGAGDMTQQLDSDLVLAPMHRVAKKCSILSWSLVTPAIMCIQRCIQAKDPYT